MRALITIVFAQFCGTSLWFCGNVAIPELAAQWELSAAARGWLLMAVQLGFITGTLTLAISGLADHFPPHRIFTVSAFLGAICNAAFLACDALPMALGLRFAVGLCLAGIYPIGMKLVVAWAPARAGATLGWLVGALTLGTSVPFLVRGLGNDIPWQYAVLAASGLALLGGILIARLGSGAGAKSGGTLGWNKVRKAVGQSGYRAAAGAYFGHMWELYTFWALVPAFVGLVLGSEGTAGVYSLTFVVFAAGAVGCVLGGMLARTIGSARVAGCALFGSALMCAVAPWLGDMPVPVALAMLIFWGLAVVTDSPQFSALSAANCPPEAVGSALAVQNGIGFAISVVAIQVGVWLWPHLGPRVGWVLLPGPLLGLWALRRLFVRPVSG